MSDIKFHEIQKNILYPSSMEKMHEVHLEVKQNLKPQVLAYEYEPLFTLGRSLRNKENSLPKDIPQFQTERGGLVTFHNPGQLVLYPILNLREMKIGLKDFIHKMENSILSCFSELSVDCYRKEACPGVFTRDGKIMSMGFRIREGVSTHGMAINISNSLQDFQGLNLCSSKSANLDRLSNHKPGSSTDSFYLMWQKHFLREFFSN